MKGRISQKDDDQTDAIEGQGRAFAAPINDPADSRRADGYHNRIDELERQHAAERHLVDQDKRERGEDRKYLAAAAFQEREQVEEAVLPPQDDAGARRAFGMGGE